MKEKIILINYTGRKGGGPLDAYEITRALLAYTPNVIAIISEYAENVDAWKKLTLKKLIVIPTYRNGKEFVKNSLVFGRIRSRIQEELSQYEISYIYCPMGAMWSQKINRICADAQVYVALHDPIPHSKDKMAPISKFLELLGFGTEKEIYQKAEGIIVHSRRYIEYVEKKYQKENKVHYLQLGRHDFYKNVAGKKSIITYDADKTNFLFFGRIDHYKGIGILLDAYERVESKHDDVTLTIAGNGNVDVYQEKCCRLKNITVINKWIEDAEVESLFTGENIIVVLPYLNATQSGVVLVAMDYQAPVIASATGGLVEQVDDGVTGVLVKPGDVDELEQAMEDLLLDCGKRAYLVKNANEYLEGASWDTMACRLLNIMGY